MMMYLKEDDKFFSFFSINWGKSEEDHRNKIFEIAVEYKLNNIDKKDIEGSLEINIQKINECIRE